MSLRDLIIHSAKQMPQALAIKDPERSVTYRELDALSDHFALALVRRGVRRGDRVGIWLEKSAYTVAAMQGVLRLSAIYVPLDPLSPVARIQTIVQDCAMQVLVTTQKRAEALLECPDQYPVTYLYLDDEDAIWSNSAADRPIAYTPSDSDDIAYILYTSGSTGKPKGVSISNRNALAFIEWATEAVQAAASDRFANHAPFHFDLSVFDLYVAFHVGASVFLIPDSISYMPAKLVDYINREQLTIWYSVPSVLVLMMEQAAFLLQEKLPLRVLLFAGEPFPIKHLRRLYKRWPQIRFLNLYGPTETNVCTFYEVTAFSLEHTKSVPIGYACSGDTIWAQKEDGTIAQIGEEGELMVTGPTVMIGYWGQTKHGKKPYATGDRVRLQEDGAYMYIGRLDHMVKIRGYRVELSEIEVALEEHPHIYEAAVCVIGSGIEAQLVAFLVTMKQHIPSLLEIKRHCAERLPRYMIIDKIHVLSSLPRTRNGKIDRLVLAGNDLS